MGDVIDGYRALKAMRKQDGKERRAKADAGFPSAKQLAFSRGMSLVCCVKGEHYQLRCRDKWLINLYPGNQRIYADRKAGKAPWLEITDEWTLTDIVTKAAEAIGHA